MKKYLTLLNEIKKLRNPPPCLIAISKGQSIEKMVNIYKEGCLDFGENRLDEAIDKIQSLPDTITWHWVGSLQRNKAAKVVEYFSVIHSIDSLKLAQKVSEASLSIKKTTKIFLQVNISQEKSKHGFKEEELKSALPTIYALPAIEILGLMTMAPLNDDKEEARSIFHKLRELRDKLKHQYPLSDLSMGMSQDYIQAIEEESTHLRIGTLIFS